MVRKIKVVNINENKPIETINQSEIGNVILNDEEHYISEPEVINVAPSSIASDEEVVIPEEPPIPTKLKRTKSKHIDVVEHNDNMDPRSLQDLANAIIKITKETNDDINKIKIDNKTEKDIAKIPCPNCHKMMSVKSLKYSHQKNCKTFKTETKVSLPVVSIVPPIQEHIPESIHKPEYPEEALINSLIMPLPKTARGIRSLAKQQRINNLMSQAF
jgi:hypothetical protein